MGSGARLKPDEHDDVLLPLLWGKHLHLWRRYIDICRGDISLDYSECKVCRWVGMAGVRLEEAGETGSGKGREKR